MFKLTREEAESSRSQFAMLNDDGFSSQNARTSSTEEILKSQIVTSSDNSSTSQIAILKGRGHNIKHLPYAFTEKRRSHVEQCSPHTISHQHQHPDHACLYGITAFLGIECPNVPTAGGYRT